MISASGDINGDGYTDVIAGAPQLSTINGTSIEGRGAVFIFYGSKTGLDASPDIIASNGPNDFGRALTVNDFDGNGYNDIAVGFEASRGQVYLFLNGPDGFSTNDTNISVVPDRIISAATTVNFGAALYSDDVDNDGRPDLLISANGHDGPLGSNQGAVYVYLAKDAYYENTSPAHSVLLEGPAAGSAIGESMSIGDIDGDNDLDLVIGAGRNGSLAGQVFIYRGEDIQWSAGDPIVPSQILSVGTASDRFGYSLSVNGDVDGDNIDDMVVGAYGDNSSRGAAYLYRSSSQYWLQPSPVPDQTFTGDVASDQLGVSVAIIADLNGDGFDEAVIGANRSETDTNDQGEARLMLGSANGLLPIGGTTHGLVDEMLGYSISDAGDINGDNRRDYVVGAPLIVASGAGQVYSFLGGAKATEPDTDLDEVGDVRDNCVNDANTNQLDMDNDGEGDVCDADIDGWLNDADNCPEKANFDQLDTDQDLEGDVCDDDDDGDGVPDVDDPFPLDSRYSVDTDIDGLPDEYEILYGLNPNDNSDAQQDLDGDGRNNLDEFTTGSDINSDDVAPQLVVPSDRVVDSIGPLTAADIGNAIAIDVHDGSVTASVDQPGPFVTGRHVLNWAASDAAGNTATEQQTVDVIPQVTLVGHSQISAEGATVEIELQLNGDPVDWPVSVPFTLGGSVDSGDYSILSTLPAPNTLAFNEPSLRTTLQLAIIEDGLTESDETLLLTLGVAENAIRGQISEYSVEIVNDNVAPQVLLDIEQQGEQRSTVYSDQGIVVSTAAVTDPNTGDTHSYNWSASDSALTPQEGFTSSTYSFNPAGLAAGIYRLSVTVFDNGSPPEPATAQRLVKVETSAPTLSMTTDSDGDGRMDASEGLADDDADGVANYLDSLDGGFWLPRDSGSQAPLQTEPGLRLVLGETALASGQDATIGFAELANHGSGGSAARLTGDGKRDFPGGIFDFEIHGLPTQGALTQVVLPLIYPLPEDASYRKYLADMGWQDFVEDALNQVSSATGAANAW